MASQRLLMYGQPLPKSTVQRYCSRFSTMGEVFPRTKIYQSYLRNNFSDKTSRTGNGEQTKNLLDELKRLPRRTQITMHV